MSQITRLLEEAESGDPSAAEELLPLVYEELRRLAANLFAREQPGQTIQPTALVHEAWLRLLGGNSQQQSWAGRNHFFAAAARAMRRILVERARRRNRGRHGGGLRRLSLEEVDVALATDDERLIDVDNAIADLAHEDPQAARVIELRFFVGLGVPEVARVLGISERNTYRSWAFGRAWLYDALTRNGSPGPS